ncbi:MAG: TIGR03118 family protein [Rhodanobacteraceae bacterium]
MKPLSTLARRLGAPLALALAISAASAAPAPKVSLPGFLYQQHNLVSDGALPADHVDPNLVNAWGIVFNPFGAVWVADNGTGVSTLYDGAGNIVPLVVQIPSPDSDSGGTPTGIVNNGSSSFVVSEGAQSGPSRFIFDTEDGVIAGWAPNVDLNHAIKVIDNSGNGAVYKGLALSAGGNGALLYATDFHNNKVDVFDGNFQPVALQGGAFRDSHIPAGFVPFGIQAIGGDLYVTYAMQDADKHDDVHGPGLGYVDVYDPNGNLLRRLASRGPLNAPWAVALAPAGFGRFSNLLLIGNFGDGHINAYDTVFGIPLGNLRGADRKPIQIDGLWGLAFGNGYLNQPVNTLYFTAGPQDESHGLYGSISAIQ